MAAEQRPTPASSNPLRRRPAKRASSSRALPVALLFFGAVWVAQGARQRTEGASEGQWPAWLRAFSSRTTCSSGALVTVQIDPERIPEFINAMEEDVVMSRDETADPGCLRFDLLRDVKQDNKFYFFECYVSDRAAGSHKKTKHYQGWAKFKESGGVLNRTIKKFESYSLPEWAFQLSERPFEALGLRVKRAELQEVVIDGTRMDEFLEAMRQNIEGSRDPERDLTVLRMDLFRLAGKKNKFLIYQAHGEGDRAPQQHKPHTEAWDDFKADAGVIQMYTEFAETMSLPGTWAFQA